ncbi:MAG: hypothetical protein EBZ48_07420, partial [Proteobacteria bacterium]|nr:hypothetical protein [Pseudomonadota bacterium]
KLLLQCSVADLTGAPLSFARALGRNLAKLFSVLTLGIGYLMAAFSMRKQGLHDIIAATVVLKQPNATVTRFVLGVLVALTLSGITERVTDSVSTRIEEKIRSIGEALEQQELIVKPGAQFKPPPEDPTPERTEPMNLAV